MMRGETMAAIADLIDELVAANHNLAF